MNPSCLFLEIGQTSLKAWREQRGVEWPVERDEAGRLTPACRERLVAGLPGFLRTSGWRPRQGAWCCLGARGVSLRRLTLPSASNEEWQRLILLQIESEFPLPPDQLAWGCLRLVPAASAQNDSAPRKEVLVVAAKKEIVQEYGELFAACGVVAEFTLSALARAALCPASQPDYAILDLGRPLCELAIFEKSALIAVRTLPWPGATGDASTPDQAAFQALASAVRSLWAGQILYLSGPGPFVGPALSELSRNLPGVSCQALDSAPGEGGSSAILGLRSPASLARGADPLVLRINAAATGPKISRPAPLSWAAMSAVLLVCCLLLPSLEGLLGSPRLEARLAALNADRKHLPAIDQELSFLQSLQQNQPPYLDALEILAKNAPQGIRLESLSMNRHGDLLLRGKLANAQQVGDLRSKLIDTGFFSTVVVEEQSPSPDRTVAVRLSAKWKPAAERASLAKASPAMATVTQTNSAPKEQAAPPPKSSPPPVSNPNSPAPTKN